VRRGWKISGGWGWIGWERERLRSEPPEVAAVIRSLSLPGWAGTLTDLADPDAALDLAKAVLGDHGMLAGAVLERST
jgi:hypothetical protein